jgi:hypothetical protein
MFRHGKQTPRKHEGRALRTKWRVQSGNVNVYDDFCIWVDEKSLSLQQEAGNRESGHAETFQPRRLLKFFDERIKKKLQLV